MYLAGVVKLRVGNHDRARLKTALSRWHHYFDASMAAARSRQGELLKCLTLWTPKLKEGQVAPGKSRLVIDGKKIHALVLEVVPVMPTLHSSCRMSMVVMIEDQLKSWLGLYAEWVNGGRKTPKPGFPEVAPATPAAGLADWARALKWSFSEPEEWYSLRKEDLWRAEVLRAAKGALLPLYFGSTASGVVSQAHCGILKRDDGRWFALLTVFPGGDALGEPVVRAANRLNRG